MVAEDTFEKATTQIPSDSWSPNDDLYLKVRNDPALQAQWVRRTFSKYGIEGMFSNFFVVTPENAHQFKEQYDRENRVRGNTLEMLTNFTEDEFEVIMTPAMEAPNLFIPTELFSLLTEGDLESAIAYHEVEHIKTMRRGVEGNFVTKEDFRVIGDPNGFHAQLFHVVVELEGYKAQLIQGSGIMSPRAIDNTKQEYLSNYSHGLK